MSNPATNVWGHPVSVGLQATVLGAVTSVSGTASSVNDAVVFTTGLGDVLNVLAGDLSTPDGPYAVPYYGRGTIQGNAFKAGDQATCSGVIKSVTNGPWGATGVLTVLTDFSQTLVTVSSGSCDTNS